MSFYTTLHYYRPTPPPEVTGRALAQFVKGLVASGVIEEGGLTSLSVKFGPRVDADRLLASWMEALPGMPRVGQLREIDWDIDEHQWTITQIIDRLEREDRPVYRVEASLGGVPQRIVTALQTRRPDDGEANLWLNSWGLQVGPVGVSDVGGDAEWQVGWIGLSLSGNGYLYPWTPRHLVARAEALPELQKVMDLCRRTWPVSLGAAPKSLRLLPAALRATRTRAIRRRMGELWPYSNLDQPWDWCWGTAESG